MTFFQYVSVAPEGYCHFLHNEHAMLSYFPTDDMPHVEIDSTGVVMADCRKALEVMAQNLQEIAQRISDANLQTAGGVVEVCC